MKTFTSVLLVLLAAPLSLFSQPDSASTFIPGRLLFAPLLAHHVEARMGMSRLGEEERLRLDIGNSIDLYRWKNVSGNAVVAVGADFFTWTSLRQEESFHFPVDAVDYLFGINVTCLRPVTTDIVLSGRMRLSHISAHLVDGSYQKEQAVWRDNQLPRVYSREYIEVIAAIDFRKFVRLYAGGQYIYHIDPAHLGKWSPQMGAEIVWRHAMDLNVHPYAATDIRFLDIDGWSASTQLQLGIKFGDWRGTGVNIFVAWFDGMSQHGEYFDHEWSYWGPGMNIEF